VLIDTYAPNWDAAEFHQIEIAADAESVYRTLWVADLGGSVLIKTLMGLRTLPGVLLHPASIKLAGPRPGRRKISLQTLIDSGFGKLAEEPDREILLGIAGKFWRPTGNVSPFSEGNFHGPVPAGLARAVWNFHVQQRESKQTILSTETRVVCSDARSRAKFRAYWFVVGPFSGLIRTLMLKSVKHECETTQILDKQMT
jgi:hypothetical protein